MAHAFDTPRVLTGALGCSRPLGILEELRAPLELDGRGSDRHAWHDVGLEAGRGGVHWHTSREGTQPGRWSVAGFPLVGRVAADAEVARLARRLGGRWRRETPVLDTRGRPHTWLWRSGDGGTILPFDPDAIVDGYRSESYRKHGPALHDALRGVARRSYYAVRPALPRSAQLALRRAFTGVQQRSPFPSWPTETALHDLCDLVLRRVADAVDAGVPCLRPWPDGRTWALVLTHDVEHGAGLAAIDRVRGVEAARGLRSSWNLVPERYGVSDRLVADLRATGCEIGVHGLRHDGRDLRSLRTLRRRLPEMHRWAERWGAVGFRSPATHRVWEWMPMLGFDYDTSSPDSDPYEPVPGGCCSWLPFFNENLVELPITLPQDHTLFVLLRSDERVWLDKAAVLRARGGMALIDTHPDYLLDDESLGRYARFLDAFGEDADAWHALPREVSAWWRQRAATVLVRRGDEWSVAGPAADRATIAVAPPSSVKPERASWDGHRPVPLRHEGEVRSVRGAERRDGRG